MKQQSKICYNEVNIIVRKLLLTTVLSYKDLSDAINIHAKTCQK